VTFLHNVILLFCDSKKVVCNTEKETDITWKLGIRSIIKNPNNQKSFFSAIDARLLLY
jgi:hypothetical protein